MKFRQGAGNVTPRVRYYTFGRERITKPSQASQLSQAHISTSLAAAVTLDSGRPASTNKTVKVGSSGALWRVGLVPVTEGVGQAGY